MRDAFWLAVWLVIGFMAWLLYKEWSFVWGMAFGR